MAPLLHRLGRFSYLRRRLVAGIWALIVALLGVGAATLSGPTSDSFTIPGVESQEALDLLDDRFPELAADGATARVVMAAPVGAHRCRDRVARRAGRHRRGPLRDDVPHPGGIA